MTIQEAARHVGHDVVYRPNREEPTAEYGVIIRVNDTWVFVLYEGSTTPAATSPHNLELLEIAA